MSTLQKLNLSSLDWIPIEAFEQIASQLSDLTELRLCSLINPLSEVTLLDAVRVLSSGCLRLKYLSLSGSRISDPILMVFADTALFPNLLCVDLTEDNSSVCYPLPYYDINPELVQQICTLRQPEPREDFPTCPHPLFVLVDPIRYLSGHHLRNFDEFEAESDFDDELDSDDVYGNIVSYSQLPEYYTLALPPNDPEAVGSDDDGDGDDDW
jgi:hypothetical protein